MDSMKFVKWQGLGNDFVMCKAQSLAEGEGETLARRLCDRHFGVGADGLIYALPGVAGESQLTMEIFNADGSIAMMCGNGIRCLAAWAVQQGWVEAGRFSISTRSGVKHVTVTAGQDERHWQVEVDMGEPEVLLVGETELNAGERLPFRIVSMGNLHRVIMNGARDKAPSWLADLNVNGVGAACEASSCGDCNVEFLTATAPGKLQVRVYERGVGETLACGTGACASLVAASLQGLCARRGVVSLPGGDLDITWAEDNRIYMRGPAVDVFAGVFYL